MNLVETLLYIMKYLKFIEKNKKIRQFSRFHIKIFFVLIK